MIASIKVGGTIYKIKYYQLDDSRLADRTGECSTNFQVITVDKTLKGQQAVNNLLHEALHAIWHEMAMGEVIKEDQEEYAVTALANGLVGLLCDNPKFTTWLSDNCS